MKYQRVKTSFFTEKDSHLLVQARRVLAALSDSTVFASPNPPLVELKAAIADYETKLYKSLDGNVLQREEKRESKKELAVVLQGLAFYVNQICNGDLTLLHSSGFPVFVARRKGTSPDMPGLPNPKDGRVSGEICLSFAPVGRDMQYEYCIAESIDKNTKNFIWGEIQYTTRSFKNYVNGFKAGQTVYFRVRARNKHGISDWTEPVRWIVR